MGLKQLCHYFLTMKKYLLLAITLLAGHISFAQLWDTVNINTSSTLAGIDFATPDTGVAVGYSGTSEGVIWSTTDGGNSWTSITAAAGTDKLLNVFFADAQTGYIVGDSGVVLKTINAGLSWSMTAKVTNAQLKAIHFLDANTGFVGGSNGTLLKTTDGGQSWYIYADTVTGTSQLIRSVFFINPNTGYITGDGGMIKMTTDGGNTWTSQANPFLGFFNGRSIRFTDASTGYIAGFGGRILRTTDAGTTWTAANTWGETDNLADLAFTNSSTGYAAGDNGTILKSIDAGLNWHPADSNITTEDLISMSFVNSNIGYISGMNGTVLKTINGATPVYEMLNDIAGINAYPNPMNEAATITYHVTGKGNIGIALYDISGRRIFADTDVKQPGTHTFEVNAVELQLKKGMYFLHLSSNSANKVLKLVVN